VIVGAAGLAALLVTSVAVAASQTLTLAPGDSVTVSCSTSLSGTNGGRQASLLCGSGAGGGSGSTSGSGSSGSGSGTSGSGSIAGVPLCNDHNSTVWHPLVKRNPDNSVNCTYGHDHGDDPHQLDSLFGPLPSYMGGSISYPWETFNATTGVLENVAKHDVYDWEVVQNQPCVGGLSFTDGRVEMHADGNMGATTRYHSYWMQAETCDSNDPSYHGSVSIGGWIDFGFLRAGSAIVPLPGIDPTGPNFNNSLERLHGSPTQPRADFTWYGAQLDPNRDPNADYLQGLLGIIKADWGPVDPNNPFGPTLFYNYGPGAPGGYYIVPWHIVGFGTVPWNPGVTTAANGQKYENFQGYVTRYGKIVSGCTAPALDCVPVSLNNIKVGSYQFRQDRHTATDPVHYYNVLAPNGQTLIQFPN
jgi:hypothetical protein